MITELFYSRILNIKRGSLHTRNFRRIQLASLLLDTDELKVALRARKVLVAFEKRAPDLDLNKGMCENWELRVIRPSRSFLVYPYKFEISPSLSTISSLVCSGVWLLDLPESLLELEADGPFKKIERDKVRDCTCFTIHTNKIFPKVQLKI